MEIHRCSLYINCLQLSVRNCSKSRNNMLFAGHLRLAMNHPNHRQKWDPNHRRKWNSFRADTTRSSNAPSVVDLCEAKHIRNHAVQFYLCFCCFSVWSSIEYHHMRFTVSCVVFMNVTLLYTMFVVWAWEISSLECGTTISHRKFQSCTRWFPSSESQSWWT